MVGATGQTAWRRAVMAAVAIGAVAVACGSTEDGPTLSAEGRRGKELAVQRSCVGCHGRSGEGGQTQAGPKWIGLYGSTVQLADGSTVVADEAYLFEAIRDPAAKQVAGWGAMPRDDLSDSDIRAIVTYITELANPVDTVPTGVLP
jgi:cytochrome c oxidase subunit II